MCIRACTPLHDSASKHLSPKLRSRGCPPQCAVRPRCIYDIGPPIVVKEFYVRVLGKRTPRPVPLDEGQNTALFVEIPLVPLENRVHAQGPSVLLELHDCPPVDGRGRYLKARRRASCSCQMIYSTVRTSRSGIWFGSMPLVEAHFLRNHARMR